MKVYTCRQGNRYHFSLKCATAGREWCEKWAEELTVQEAEERNIPPCHNCVVVRA